VGAAPRPISRRSGDLLGAGEGAIDAGAGTAEIGTGRRFEAVVGTPAPWRFCPRGEGLRRSPHPSRLYDGDVYVLDEQVARHLFAEGPPPSGSLSPSRPSRTARTRFPSSHRWPCSSARGGLAFLMRRMRYSRGAQAPCARSCDAERGVRRGGRKSERCSAGGSRCDAGLLEEVRGAGGGKWRDTPISEKNHDRRGVGVGAAMTGLRRSFADDDDQLRAAAVESCVFTSLIY